jgi:hypothetical protein
MMAVATLVVGVLSAGCFDSATPSGAAGSGTEGVTGITGDATLAAPHWRIRYEIGFPQPVRRRLPRCPAGVRCHDIIAKGWSTSSGKPLWARMVTRTLVCPSGTGDYPHGQSACRALATLRTVLARKTAGECSCPPPAGVVGQATLVRAGRPITLPLEFCPYCGHGDSQAVDRDLQLLTPHRA